MIYRFHRADIERDNENWQEFLFKYESLLVLATKWHHRSETFTGLQGTDGMPKFKDVLPAQMAIASSIVKRISAWVPAAYRPSFDRLNLVHFERSKPPSLVSSPGLGVDLALGFELSLSSELSKALLVVEDLATTHVSAELVQAFSEKGCLCGLGTSEKENERLIEAVVYSQSVLAGTEFDLQLNRSFELFLEMAEQGAANAEPSLFDEILFRNGNRGAVEIAIPTHLESTFVAWRTLVLRSYQQYSLELLWTCLHRGFGHKAFAAEEIRQLAVRSSRGLADLPSEWKMSWREDMTVGDVRGKLSEKLINSKAKNGMAAFSSDDGLSEFGLLDQSLSAFKDNKFEDAINCAALLLLSTAQRMDSLGLKEHDTLLKKFFEDGGVYSLGIKQIATKLHEMENFLWCDFIQYLLETWALGKHLWTASMKFADRQIATFRFEVVESGYVARGNSDFGAPTSKIGSIMSLCENLGLVEKVIAPPDIAKVMLEAFGEEQAKVFRITSEGKRSLERLREMRQDSSSLEDSD